MRVIRRTSPPAPEALLPTRTVMSPTEFGTEQCTAVSTQLGWISEPVHSPPAAVLRTSATNAKSLVVDVEPPVIARAEEPESEPASSVPASVASSHRRGRALSQRPAGKWIFVIDAS